MNAPDAPVAERSPSGPRWGESDRFVPTRVVQPVQRLLALETAGGVAMLVAAIVALVWANSPLYESYFQLWATPFDVRLGASGPLHIDLTLRDAVNDILMTFFFYLAALEIKHELVHGNFRDKRAAALPGMAALGGMVVPAAVFLAFNAGGEGAGGWGIPMATDIAFAVAVVTLLGKRIPLAARAFLLTLAVADDIGGILVIALFYSGDLSLGWLGLATVAVAASYVAQRLQIRSYAPYLLLGAIAWFSLHESGVHATIAGVVLGLMTPAKPFYAPRTFGNAALPLIRRVERVALADHQSNHDKAGKEAGLRDLVRLSVETMSPLERHLAWAGPWVAFAIVPIFALANAGVRVVGGDIGNPFTDPVVLGPALGLLLGKSLGIFGASFLAVKTNIGRLPEGVSWLMVLGVATTGGVGFTVALFISNLSFDTVAVTDRAKLGVLAGSIVAGIAGYVILRIAASRAASGTAGREPVAR